MKFKELANKNQETLTKELAELKDKRDKLRLKIRLGEVKDTSEFSKVRRDIARILTKLASI